MVWWVEGSLILVEVRILFMVGSSQLGMTGNFLALKRLTIKEFGQVSVPHPRAFIPCNEYKNTTLFIKVKCRDYGLEGEVVSDGCGWFGRVCG